MSSFLNTVHLSREASGQKPVLPASWPVPSSPSRGTGGLRRSRLLLRGHAEKKNQLECLGDSRVSNPHPKEVAFPAVA